MAQKTPKSNALPPVKTKGQFTKYFRKGNYHYSKGEYASAAKFLNAVWQYDDSVPEITIQLSDCLFQMGRQNQALDLLIYTWQKHPDKADICTVIGSAALRMNFFDLALKAYEHYTKLQPNDPKGYVNLATALRENDRLDEAISLLQEIIPIYPENDEMWNALGAAVQLRDGPAQSLVFFEESYRLNPTSRQILNNLPGIYYDLGQIDKAKETVLACLERYNDFASPHLLYSKILLNEGRLSEGWSEYKWRHHSTNPSACLLPYKIDYWNKGIDIKGKNLLLSAEQGVGDELLATPVYRQLIEMVEHLYIGCDSRLVPLFETSFPEATILPYSVYALSDGRRGRTYQDLTEEQIEQIDYMCFNLDAVSNLWQSVEDIKPMAQILDVTKDLRGKWKTRIEKLPKKLNIGVCWRSGVLHATRKTNYTELDNWLPILKNENVNFVNVQYGNYAEELKKMKEKHGIKIHNFDDLDLKNDFAGTIALMQNLDLVIGPTTTPVAEAACAGVAVWWLSNGQPWWTYGQKNPPWLEKGVVHAKDPAQPWPDFMTEMGKTFYSWVKSHKSGN
ncbi:tetratricopeptide repeat protein [Emcibacter sp.]|uniref:tetratricopeptide repeat protein n=1 Tax=Emcibacter sp. TaxID=1979954 RepID=UPI002AA8DA7F|nr:tetratricopeptide repeat protein [Emcibacter sp.]